MPVSAHCRITPLVTPRRVLSSLLPGAPPIDAFAKHANVSSCRGLSGLEVRGKVDPQSDIPQPTAILCLITPKRSE